MPYLVSSIIAIVTALIILMTRYEADDSTITSEIERAKSMFTTIDGFVNTYIQSGGDMTMGDTINTETYKKINFATLYKDGILFGNISKENILKVNLNDNKHSSEETDKNKFFESQLQFPNSNIIWQIVPIVIGDKYKDSSGIEKDISTSAGAGYKIFVNFTNNPTLKNKDSFSENFFGKEVCEKTFFGTFLSDGIDFDANFKIVQTGNLKDSKFVCIVFK